MAKSHVTLMALRLRIREVVRALGGTGGAAEAAHTTPDIVDRWLTGKARPTATQTAALAKASSYNEEWLATGEGKRRLWRTSMSAELLRGSAAAIVERQRAYGTPADGFSAVAKFWSIILGQPIEPHQVALCLDAVKTSRILHNPTHLDSWTDKAGYTAIGAELAGAITKERG